MARIPRLRTRLIALAIGVVLVAGSVALVVRSNRECPMYFGLGGALTQIVYGNAWGRGGLAEWRPGVYATGWFAHDENLRTKGRGDIDVLESVVQKLQGAQIWICGRRYRSGIWGATRVRDFISMDLAWDSESRYSSVPTYSQSERDAEVRLIRETAAHAPAPSVMPIWLDAAFLASGECVKTRMEWSGYAINAATIVGLGLIGWGSVGAFVALRAQRRIGKHQCVRCRYDLRGSPGGVCPECGTERVVCDAGEVSPAPPL